MTQKSSHEKPGIFLDASCWVAAAGSPTGGSALILKLARRGYLQIMATKRILLEAERNINSKMGEEALLHYYQELGATEVELIDPPTAEEEARWRYLVAEKDCHVLAGAFKAYADVLVSLDRRHILTEKVEREFPITVMDTNDFLKEFIDKLEISKS
ncbi:MAG: PIN domain-containing protein [Syntrophothermus sp.]|uniref:PIN domain-containing protein n=1 Tax=Syntrophothermus sp. TaxID=2736299 RepID=UPI00257FEBE3|nr:PIN domain-containing protein [Syntrophothermus sp.]NSW83152.1 PIN domain-containing protein [Syntrophothermus sp.]